MAIPKKPRAAATTGVDVRRILSGNAIHTAYRMAYLGNHFIGPVYKVTDKAYGIRRPHFAILFALAALGEISARDVCEITGFPRNTISRAVADLESRGYLKRSDHADDARMATLAITGDGRRVHDAILPMFKQREAGMLAVLTTQECAALSKLLAKLVLREDGWAQQY